MEISVRLVTSYRRTECHHVRGLAACSASPPQVVAVKHQQVKGAGHRQIVGSPAVQRLEIGHPLAVEADHLGVEDR
jgi:hypothetical protein